MPFRSICNIPNDSLVQMERFFTDVPPEVREFYYSGIGNIMVSPTSYLLKGGDAIGIQVTAIHPAWYYSGLNYDDGYLCLLGRFQHYNSDAGVEASIFVANSKYTTTAYTHAGIVEPSSTGYQMMDDIPVHYYGKSVAQKKPQDPGYNTFLTKQIDEDFIRVTCLSPWEYEIEVLQDLEEEQCFYIPETCAKGLPNTVWGKIGTDSTLPYGASCGLIKIRSEALLDAMAGCNLLTGAQLAAVTMPDKSVFKNSYSNTSGHPAWMLNLRSTTFEGLEQYQVLKSIVDTNVPYYALGYKMGCCTVGTGIFVRNGNIVGALSFGQATNGISYKRRATQSPSSNKAKFTIGEMLDCEDYFKDVARAGSDTEKLPVGSVIPFSASELQFESKKDNPEPYQAPINPSYKYAYIFHNTLLPVAITPTYIPNAATITCYMPRIQNSTSTIVSMIQVRDLNDEVDAYLYPDSSWLMYDDPEILPKIKPYGTMNYVGLENPTNGMHRDIWGFAIKSHMDERPVTDGYGHYLYTIYSGSAEIKWHNPTMNPTTGSDANSGNYTNNVMISGIVMAFVGSFKAGTPKGKYLYKPFETVQTSAGCLVSIDPEYKVSPSIAKLKPETTMVPYLGQNIITAETANIDWETSSVNSEDNVYKFWQVIKYVGYNREITTKIKTTKYMTIDVDETAMIGYPVADRPMLIDIDDWSGDKACDIGDIAMTGPFIDKETQTWQVIAASAQMKKLYRIDVEVSEEGNYVTKFLRVRDSKELFDTPYGNFIEVLGLAYTTDIHYLEKAETEEDKSEYAADVLFLVDDSLEMETMIGELKDNIDDLLLRLDAKDVKQLRIGAAVFDTNQKALTISDEKWATTLDDSSELVKSIATQMTESTDYSTHPWSALNWAIDEYVWGRDILVKEIILITNGEARGDLYVPDVVIGKLQQANINVNVITDKVMYYGNLVKDTNGVEINSGSGDNWGENMVERIGGYISNVVESAYRVIKEEGAIAFYGRTTYEDSARVAGSNLVVGTFRTNMEWDVNKDTICRVRVCDEPPNDYQINEDINWPRGIAVMYPYIYILGYTWSTTPSNPKLDPLVSSEMSLSGNGWQMALWKIDITSGINNNTIQLQDVTDMRFTFGIPAKDKDAIRLWKDDMSKLGGVMKYTWGPTDPNKLPVSTELPLKSASLENPAVAGIFSISGQLIAFSNYHEKLVTINPITGCIEELGTSIYPFTYPYNSNTCVSGDVISSVSRFGGRNYYTAHPYFHLCIGDGLIPNKYGSGIDIQDISKGQVLVRQCKVKNNLLRDSLYDIDLLVPDPNKLPGSEMLYVSLTGSDLDKAKRVRITGPVLPGMTSIFYIHIQPGMEEVADSLILYLNSKFGRVTEFFGYRNRMGEVQ